MTDITPEALEALSKKALHSCSDYYHDLCRVLIDLYRTGQLVMVPSGDGVAVSDRFANAGKPITTSTNHISEIGRMVGWYWERDGTAIYSPKPPLDCRDRAFKMFISADSPDLSFDFEVSGDDVDDLKARLRNDNSDYVYTERHEAAARIKSLEASLAEAEGRVKEARRQAFEEAAKVADERANACRLAGVQEAIDPIEATILDEYLSECAQAIRALAQNPTGN